jgi:hypothetical protein
LYSVLDTITVCPVAFEIYERLKKEYGFQRKHGLSSELFDYTPDYTSNSACGNALSISVCE